MATIGVSVFSTPITQGTRTQRAQAVAKNKNANGKLDQLLQFAHYEEMGLKSAGVNVFGTPITRGTRTQRAQAAAKIKNADGKLDQFEEMWVQSAGVSVFGTPITQGTRTQRAQAAAKNKNADGKLDQLLQFAHNGEIELKSANVNKTYCFIYNATGDPITHVTAHDWQGHIAGRGPEIIQNGEWAFLKHVGTPDPNPKGSIGAVVFNIQNYTDTMIAWSNPIKSPAIFKNTVYCQMNDPGYFNYCDWNELYHGVRDSGTEYETSMEDFTINVRIDAQGSIPQYWAEFNLNAP